MITLFYLSLLSYRLEAVCKLIKIECQPLIITKTGALSLSNLKALLLGEERVVLIVMSFAVVSRGTQIRSTVPPMLGLYRLLGPVSYI